jgi:Histidine kinase-, DNA gyrase B-, and HSP90-like ATPase
MKVDQTIGPGLLKVLVPPFSFQPLVENAIQHGLHSSPGAGRLRLVVRATGPWLEMSVTDDGQGVAPTEVEQLFFAEGPRVHALVLLRRRLQGLFGRSFRLVVRSHMGEGTTVTICIPLRKQFGAGQESSGAIPADLSQTLQHGVQSGMSDTDRGALQQFQLRPTLDHDGAVQNRSDLL